MPRLKAANNAKTTLAAAIDAVQTSFTVTDASLFPDPPFRITVDAEIMEVGAIDRTTGTFSNVTRGVEGTTAAPHAAGASVENRFTAGTFGELVDDDHTHSGLPGDAPNVPWDNVSGKPSTFPPSAHASTHKSTGSDPLAPADIGAVANAGATPSVMAGTDASKPAAGVAGRVYIATDTKKIYRDNGTAWVQLPTDLPLGATIGGNTAWHAGNDGAGSGLDADLLDGAHKADITKLSAMAVVIASGSIALSSGYGTLAIQAGANIHRFYLPSCYSGTVYDVAQLGPDRAYHGCTILRAVDYDYLYFYCYTTSATLYYKVYQFTE